MRISGEQNTGEMNERRMKFVLEHYRERTKSTEEALDDVYTKAGTGRITTAVPYFVRYAVTVFAVAASLLLVLVISGRRQNAWTEYYAEAEKAVVSLSDGSVITLAPGASVRIQERKNPRHVELDGKAYFEVFHDESLPFTVSAGQSLVKVLGTKFVVSNNAGGTTVDVTEGKVRFSAKQQDEGEILTEGMSAALLGDSRKIALQEEGCINPAAWATGVFVYDQTPLDYALKELASFYGVEMSVEPESASSLSFTGKFSSGSLEDITYSIETALGVKISVR